MSLPFEIHWPSFGLGVAVIVLLGFVVFVINWLGKGLGSAAEPQKVSQSTSKTPLQVVMGCGASLLLVAGFGFLAALVVLMVVFRASWAEVTWVVGMAAIALFFGAIMRASAG